MKTTVLDHPSPASNPIPPSLLVDPVAHTAKLYVHKDDQGLVCISCVPQYALPSTRLSQGDAAQTLLSILMPCLTSRMVLSTENSALAGFENLLIETISSLPVGAGCIDLSEFRQLLQAYDHQANDFVYVGAALSSSSPTGTSIESAAISPFDQLGLVCRRDQSNGEPRFNIAQITHPYPDCSPKMDWSDDDKSRNTLASNALYQLQQRQRGLNSGNSILLPSLAYLSSFSEIFLATMPTAGGRIPLETLDDWVTDHPPTFARV